MLVRILRPFSVDTAAGRVRYEPGQIVPAGQTNWVEKGLAKADVPEKKDDKP